MRRKVDERFQVIFVTIFSLISSSVMLVAGCVLVRKSRKVSENVGLKVYQIYGGAILDGIKNLLPRIPGIDEVIKELDIVIHDVLIDDIGETLDTTVVIIGIVLIIIAALQLIANSILLFGALSRKKQLIPSVLLTRLFYLSTFWGIIDSFRKTFTQEEMSVFLV